METEMKEFLITFKELRLKEMKKVTKQENKEEYSLFTEKEMKKLRSQTLQQDFAPENCRKSNYANGFYNKNEKCNYLNKLSSLSWKWIKLVF